MVEEVGPGRDVRFGCGYVGELRFTSDLSITALSVYPGS